MIATGGHHLDELFFSVRDNYRTYVQTFLISEIKNFVACYKIKFNSQLHEVLELFLLPSFLFLTVGLNNNSYGGSFSLIKNWSIIFK